MPTLTIELPTHAKQTAFNLRRWAKLLADPELAKFEGRIETDRHGHILKSPPPAFSHGSFQSEIAYYFERFFRMGERPLSVQSRQLMA